jgi:hypothetical protein
LEEVSIVSWTDTVAADEAEIEAEAIEGACDTPSLLSESSDLGVIDEKNGQVDHAESCLRLKVGQ